MGKAAWMKALFADLAPKSDNDSGYEADPATARWDRQRTMSSPPKSSTQEEAYDIAAHARSSLQIKNTDVPSYYNDHYRSNTPISPSYSSRPASHGAPAATAGWQQYSHAQPGQPPYGQPSTSNSARTRPATNSPPPPLGPRPALFPQEIPYHGEVNMSPIGRNGIKANGCTSPGGFVNPRNALHAQKHHHSAPVYVNGPPRATPPLSNGRHQASIPSSSSLSPSRHHISSTPTRPAFLATPPPRVPHRPNSDSQTSSPSPKKAGGKSPSISRSTSDEGASVKPNQCHGTTGAGKRCTRIVKAKPNATKSKGASSSKETIPPLPSVSYRMNHNALKQLDRRLSVRRRIKPKGARSPNRSKVGRIIEISDSENEEEEEEEEDEFEKARISPVKTTSSSSDEQNLEELPVFCFQHVKQTLEQRGTFINAKSVDFQDWIPSFLPQETQLQLRHEMAKPRSEERRGYIYVHEFPFSSGNTEATTFIKLGRSVRPVARLSEWRSQCRSRQPVVRDIFPLYPSHPLHPNHTSPSIINAFKASPSHQHGRLLFAEQGARYHQRWERLCLIELAGRAAVQAQYRQDDEMARQACVDCGKIHVELFLVDKGSYERDIREMVLRWQKFVETVL